MKPLLAKIIWLLLIPHLAWAEDVDRRPRGQGYALVGLDPQEADFVAGFGGEVYASNGLGVGAEMGGAGLLSGVYATGVGSADVSYHFFPKKILGNAAPFVSGGYTGFFGHHKGSGALMRNIVNGYNVGGGVDFFTIKHFGVRLDVRYYGREGRIVRNLEPHLFLSSFVAFRIGVTFR